MQVLAAIAPLDLIGEVDVGGLGLAVGYEGLVAIWLVESQVVEVDAVSAVAGGRDAHDARWEVSCCGFEECVFEALEEQEVREVIDAELGFVAVGCEVACGVRHDAGVVDEEVEC